MNSKPLLDLHSRFVKSESKLRLYWDEIRGVCEEDIFSEDMVFSPGQFSALSFTNYKSLELHYIDCHRLQTINQLFSILTH